MRTDDAKTLRDGDEVAAGDWGAVFRVDAVEFGPLHVLHHDGLWGSSIWRYDGTRATTARFDNDSRQIPFAALGREPERILIIGAAGGNEIQAALTYGVGHVDAVELNPVTVGLLENEFADYAGNLTTRDNVDYIQGDGRTFLARTDNEYDMVWFVAPDTYAASNAATSGAFVLSESYLYTEEMIAEAYDHLTPDGMIVTQFGDFDFDERPTRTARYLVTAREALRGEQTDFSRQTALLVNRGEVDLDRFSTMLLFKNPPEDDASSRLEESIDARPRHRGAAPAGRFAPRRRHHDRHHHRHALSEVAAIVDGYEYDISSIDDDRPFFWHFTPFGDLVGDWSRSYDDTEIAIGERLLMVLIIIAFVVASAFLWLPFALTRRRGAARPRRVDGRGRMFVYFASIGLGFMFIEISMIQRFSLLLGYPTLSLSVSLFTLLLATAIGARLSGRIGAQPATGLPAAVASAVRRHAAVPLDQRSDHRHRARVERAVPDHARDRHAVPGRHGARRVPPRRHRPGDRAHRRRLRRRPGPFRRMVLGGERLLLGHRLVRHDRRVDDIRIRSHRDVRPGPVSGCARRAVARSLRECGSSLDATTTTPCRTRPYESRKQPIRIRSGLRSASAEPPESVQSDGCSLRSPIGPTRSGCRAISLASGYAARTASMSVTGSPVSWIAGRKPPRRLR